MQNIAFVTPDFKDYHPGPKPQLLSDMLTSQDTTTRKFAQTLLSLYIYDFKNDRIVQINNLTYDKIYIGSNAAGSERLYNLPENSDKYIIFKDDVRVPPNTPNNPTPDVKIASTREIKPILIPYPLLVKYLAIERSITDKKLLDSNKEISNKAIEAYNTALLNILSDMDPDFIEKLYKNPQYKNLWINLIIKMNDRSVSDYNDLLVEYDKTKIELDNSKLTIKEMASRKPTRDIAQSSDFDKEKIKANLHKVLKHNLTNQAINITTIKRVRGISPEYNLKVFRVYLDGETYKEVTFAFPANMKDYDKYINILRESFRAEEVKSYQPDQQFMLQIDLKKRAVMSPDEYLSSTGVREGFSDYIAQSNKLTNINQSAIASQFVQQDEGLEDELQAEENQYEEEEQQDEDVIEEEEEEIPEEEEDLYGTED